MTQTTATSQTRTPTERPERGSVISRPHGENTDDPRLDAARHAEQRVYDYYGIEFTEHYVDVDELDLRMRVVVVGAGSPIVLITGGTGVGLEWVPLLPELRGHTLYIMDRPGAGFSEEIDHRSISLPYQAVSATNALFDHFELETAPVIGNSIGGLWAIQYALTHPERVTAIALLGCPAFYPGTSAPLPLRLGSVPLVGGYLFEHFIQPDDAAGARENWDFLGQSTRTIQRLPDEFAEAWYRMQNLPHAKLAWVSLLQSVVRLRGARPAVVLTPDDLAAVEVPVLLIWGRGDTFGSPEQGRRCLKYFQDVSFHEVDGGHLPWLDEPETCGDLLWKFVAQHR